MGTDRPGDTATQERPAVQIGEAEPEQSERRPSWLPLVAMVVVLAIPLIVAVSVLLDPHWHFGGEHAMTEMRVRDVWTSHPPLIGLGGRLNGGSHPGPLSFWSLSIFYRLLGTSGPALLASTAVLHIVAMGLTLWLARRRGGLGLLLVTGAVLAALASAYGGRALTLPWNPFLPVLWWMVVLVGVWSLLDGDLPAFPVTVFAASFCMQTHISYVAIGSALVGLGALGFVYGTYRRRRDGPERKRAILWGISGVVVAVVVWFPPVAEQITGSEGGNLGTLFHYFTDATQQPIGEKRGLTIVLAHLDPWSLLSKPAIEGRAFLSGPTLAGKLFLVTWVAAALASWRLRHKTLMRLHLVIAVALAASVFTVSRIIGPTWAYLGLWIWGNCALILFAVAWSFSLTLDKAVPASARPRLATAGAAAACVVLLIVTTRFTVAAAYVQPNQPEISVAVAEVVGPTVAALEEGSLPGTGRDSRYLVTWSDLVYWDARGYALFNELDREGFDVKAPSKNGVSVTWHRVLEGDDADAHVRLSVGDDIDEWKDRPGYHQVAFYDPDASREGGDFAELRTQIVEGLRNEGRADLVDRFIDDPEGFPTGLSERVAPQVKKLKNIGAPVAVFVGPVPKD
jgi:hypothetical protein